jgi:hypothetical protein
VADITVSVSSPGILGFGQEEFGNQYFGGENLSATTSIGISQFINNTGWGANEWGILGWGVDFANSDVSLTGSQINLDEGSVTTDFQPDAGWGVVGFGDVPWGEGPDVTVIINEGQLAAIEGFTFSIQIDGNISINVQDEHNLLVSAPNGITTAADANVNVTGSQINLIVNSVAITGNASVDVTGSQRNIQIDSVITTIGVSVDVQGTQINFLPVGQVIEVITVDVFPTGSRINVTEGLAGAIITGDANVSVTGSQINLTVNQVGVSADGNISVVADENQINIAIGNEDTTADANVNVTGSRINLTPGEVTYAAGYDVTGSRINTLINSVTVTGNAVVNLTGIRLNITTGSANVTAWAEVQTGANNIWTPVDLAA